MSGMTPEMETLKTRLKATWMSGDYAEFAKPMEPGALSSSNGSLSRRARRCSTSAAARARSPFPPRAPGFVDRCRYRRELDRGGALTRQRRGSGRAVR